MLASSVVLIQCHNAEGPNLNRSEHKDIKYEIYLVTNCISNIQFY